MAKNAQTRASRREVSPASSRSKRQEILTTAIEHFGRHGYEYTKWADIATDVGLGSTALYHYFESKLHCLFEIHAEALEAERERFERLTADRGDFGPTLARVLNGLFDLTEHEVLRNRVLVAEEGLIAVPRKSPREEEARRLARSRMRDIEFAWAAFLTRGMEQGAIPEADPRLLTHALLGLVQERLALVPARRRPVAGRHPRLLRRALPGRGRLREARSVARRARAEATRRAQGGCRPHRSTGFAPAPCRWCPRTARA